MSFRNRFLRLVMLTAFGTLVILAGCAARVGYRTYDPYYRDYHVWSGVEVPYYNNWIIETRRSRIEYRRLRRADRENYWRWRHNHR
jgi:hypothetical protein